MNSLSEYGDIAAAHSALLAETWDSLDDMVEDRSVQASFYGRWEALLDDAFASIKSLRSDATPSVVNDQLDEAWIAMAISMSHSMSPLDPIEPIDPEFLPGTELAYVYWRTAEDLFEAAFEDWKDDCG